MTEWRMIQAQAGEAKRFELHGDTGKILSVDCKRAMTLDELKALLSPKAAGIDPEISEWLNA